MFRRIISCLLGGLILAALSAPLRADGVGESEIGFYGGRPVLRVELGGITAIDVVLDTGAQGLILEQRRARFLPLTPAGTRQMRSPGGDGLTGMRYEPQAISFAGLDLGRLGIMATDLSALLDGDNAPAGILGLWTIETGTIKIDYGHRSIKLNPKGALDPKAPGVLPLTRDRKFAFPTFPIDVGGKVFPARLDTGSNMVLMLGQELADELPLTGEPSWVGTARLLDGERALLSARLEGDVRISRYRLAAPELHFLEGASGVNVGSGLFADGRITIDRRNGLILLEPGD